MHVFCYIMLLFVMVIAVPFSPPDLLETRQIGDIQCNVERLKTVAALGKAQGAVKKLAQNATGEDATLVATAASGLNSASAGIKTIAGAILTGQTAPASARDQVGTGLETAQSALSNVTTLYVASHDHADERDASDALGDVNDALTAGAAVVADCN